jgi:DSF synthase
LLDEKFAQLKIEFNAEYGALWVQFNQPGVPCFNLPLLKEAQSHQAAIKRSGGVVSINGVLHEIRYSVSSSLKPDVYSLGGHLSLFRDLIRTRNREALRHYGQECINTMFPRFSHYELPITTIGLVQGRALGGGFETALNNDFIIAEKGSQFGFPEILFNLFPGMGAYNILSRKIGAQAAENLLLSGKTYSPEELQVIGLVDVVAEKGEGIQAVYDFIRKNQRRANGLNGIQRTRYASNPITYRSLMQIIDVWVDTALRLEEKDLKVMDRFVRQQERVFTELVTDVVPFKKEQPRECETV